MKKVNRMQTLKSKVITYWKEAFTTLDKAVDFAVDMCEKDCHDVQQIEYDYGDNLFYVYFATTHWYDKDNERMD